MKTRSFTAADLQRGKEYEVLRSFEDYDGVTHNVGDRWVFKEKNFVPHDDGLSLFVEIEGIQKQIRLQWRENQQLETIEAFSEYVKLNSEPSESGNG